MVWELTAVNHHLQCNAGALFLPGEVCPEASTRSFPDGTTLSSLPKCASHQAAVASQLRNQPQVSRVRLKPQLPPKRGFKGVLFWSWCLFLGGAIWGLHPPDAPKSKRGLRLTSATLQRRELAIREVDDLDLTRAGPRSHLLLQREREREPVVLNQVREAAKQTGCFTPGASDREAMSQTSTDSV